jgi:hypothetical protein
MNQSKIRRPKKLEEFWGRSRCAADVAFFASLTKNTIYATYPTAQTIAMMMIMVKKTSCLSLPAALQAGPLRYSKLVQSRMRVA